MEEKIKRLANNISMSFSNFSKMYAETLNATTLIMETDTELAKLSSWDFVHAFRPTAKAMAEMLSDPYTESYLRFAKEAKEMLARGDDPVEVLWHFDIRLEKMRRD